MILTRIEIENYKHFVGPVEIDVPAMATIGVIGENGAGKTTLFEAIEWCLYAPRAISPSDIRPRTGTGHTRVLVYLESIDGARQFVVERVLKRTPTATVYQLDEAGDPTPLVQGSRQVSEYVATSLIGLSHTAFTATFFTRQKELHLFGEETPARRREEIGKLLGLETIRMAQKSFTADRSRAQAEARMINQQYDRESQGRDLDAERTAARGSITESEQTVKRALVAIEQAESARATAETAVSAARTRHDALVAANHQHQRLQADIGHAEKRANQIRSDLVAIDRRSSERESMAAVAARKPALESERTTQEQARELYLRAERIDRDIRNAQTRRKELDAEMGRIVDQVRPDPAISGWEWTTPDLVDPNAGTTRLLAAIDALDIRAAEQRDESTRQALALKTSLSNARDVLERYQRKREELDNEERAYREAGDPDAQKIELDRRRSSLVAQLATLQANQTNLENQRDSTSVLIGNLTRQDFGDNCPTCGRPFTAADASAIEDVLRGKVQSLGASIKDVSSEAQRTITAIDDVDKQLKAVYERLQHIEAVRKRIDKSVTHLESQRDTTKTCEAALAECVAHAQLGQVPDEAMAQRTRKHLETTRAMHQVRITIANGQRNYAAIRDEFERLTTERTGIGEVSFDEQAFARLNRELLEASKAQGALAQLDQDIARKPALEQESQELIERTSTLSTALEANTAELAGLADAPDSLRLANEQLSQATAGEQSARTGFHQGQLALQRAETALEAIDREQVRLENLAKLANERQRDADHLDLMVKEMTEFERFAAGRKVPILGDYTSELVRTITDGRYERVEFDQDYGMMVFDGENAESSYQLSSFSGGERDVITLSARLALSQMIGRQATNQPGFLVLDEVFGSLDSARRSNLLDLLGTISSVYDDLRQIFIISHVDDVKSSPSLDELWRVEDTGDGSSAVRSLDPGQEIETT